jgi:hypothetical protein
VSQQAKPTEAIVIPPPEPRSRRGGLSPATNVALQNMLAERARQANAGAVDPSSVDAEFQRF